MVLHYKFEYASNNSMMTEHLKRCAESFVLDYRIQQDQSFIHLFVQSSTEILTEFSNKLSHYIPMSIFFKDVTVHSVEAMPDQSIAIIDESPLQTFCTKCLNEVEDQSSVNFYNPFLYCDECGQDLGSPTLVLYDGMKKIEKANNIEYFETIAKMINDGKHVEIKTLSGEFVFFKIQPFAKKYQDRIKFLCTDLNRINEVVVANKSETVALASVEKPSIDLRFTQMFEERSLFDHEEINVRYANDLMLYLLSRELEKYGIAFLAYVENARFDASLTFAEQKSYDQIKVPKISIVNESQTLVLENGHYDSKLDKVYATFEQKSKSQLMVLLSENNLFEKSILSFYLSSKHNDGINLYSPKIEGVLDIVKFDLPSTMQQVCETIASDDTGKRLIENYKKKFEKDIEIAKCFNFCKLDKNSIFSMWKIVSLILGFDESVLEQAKKAVLNKGPRMDYRLFKDDHFYNQTFDIYSLIKSGMSYRIAGVDQTLLCLGYCESLAHFIANLTDDIHKEHPLDGVALSGDFFGHEVISHFVHKAITKNHKIYYNKDFAIQRD